MEEEDRNSALEQLQKKNDGEIKALKRDLSDLELQIEKADQDKASKQHQIKALNEEIRQQEEVIQRMNKEKRMIQDRAQKNIQDLQDSSYCTESDLLFLMGIWQNFNAFTYDTKDCRIWFMNDIKDCSIWYGR